MICKKTAAALCGGCFLIYVDFPPSKNYNHSEIEWFDNNAGLMTAVLGYGAMNQNRSEDL